MFTTILYKSGVKMSYYSIYEVAKMLNTSHTTIYNKLKNKEVYKLIKKFIKIDGKTKSISADGIEILKEHINHNKSCKDDIESFIKVYKDDVNVSKDNNNQIINILEKQIQELQKDKQELYKQLQEEKKIQGEVLFALRNEQERTRLLEEAKRPWYKKLFNK